MTGFDLLHRQTLPTEPDITNAELSSALTLKHFNTLTALPAVLFVFLCIITASVLVSLWRSKTPKK
ncbi:MAG: hypothetical protein ACLFPX_04465 [Candidatus Omnitrophota bacterium]